MKSYAIALLAVTTAAQTWEQDVALAGGVIYGLTGENHYDDMVNCFTDADIFVYALIHAFKLATEGDMRGRIAGYRLIVNVVSDFPSYIYDCGHSGDDWVEFGKWFDIFIHPVGLVDRVSSNLVHNLRDILKESL